MKLNEDLLIGKKSVAVALSGGKDSMALLNLLLESKTFKGQVKAINVEHGMRGESSVKDSEFVKSYCKQKNVPLKCYTVNAPEYSEKTKTSLEEGARILRYSCFKDAYDSGFCDAVATAHHLSDNAETMLFNLFRGSSLYGMSGIKEQNGIYIRPILSVSREEIDLYVDKNAIPYVQDETNFDENYTRNFLRLKIIPLIKQIFPEVENSLKRFADESKLVSDYLNEVAEKTIIYGKEVKIPVSADSAIISLCTIKALKYLGVYKDYERKHSQLTLKLLNCSNGTTIDLIKNVKAVKDYDFITLYKAEEKENEQVNFKTGTTVFNGKEITVKPLNNGELKGKKELYFDLDKIPPNAVFRTRMDGDNFTPFKSGSKKLKKYLIDKKIPSRKRDKLTLIACGNEVYAILGVEISDKIKIEKNTQNIYTMGEKLL